MNEQQEEELEALSAIFEDDECFKKCESDDGALSYQYRFVAENENHSFILDMICPASYPEVRPNFSLDLFYNNHILPLVKSEIIEKLNSFCEELLDEAMIYSVIDYVKDNHQDLVANQTLVFQEDISEVKAAQVKVSKAPKKEQLTKAQKRKLADRVNVDGERARGWNWVDLVKHLSQTGRQNEDE